MPIAPAAFYDVASRMHFARALDYSKEECPRTAAGRLYYAAFLATRDSFRLLTGDPAYHLEHKPLADFLRYRVDDEWVERFGQMLEELRRLRVESDYHPERTVAGTTVGLRLRDAEWLVNSQGDLQKHLRGVRLPPSDHR